MMRGFSTVQLAGLLLIGLADVPLRAAQSAESRTTSEAATKLPPLSSRSATIVEAMKIMDEFGRCLVRSKAKLAALAVSTELDDAAISRAAQRPDASECLASPTSGFDSRLRFQKELLRGSVFKALYAQKHGLERPTFSAQPIDWTATTATMNANTAERFRIYRQIAGCTLAAAPDQVHQLVMAEYGAEAHKAAFAQLAPAMGNCLTGIAQLTLQRPVMAGALAEVAYRSAEAKSP
jgi:hypothetical protein